MQAHTFQGLEGTSDSDSGGYVAHVAHTCSHTWSIYMCTYVHALTCKIISLKATLMYVGLCVCVCMCVYVCVCVYIYIYIYTHTHTHIIITDMYVCLFVCRPRSLWNSCTQQMCPSSICYWIRRDGHRYGCMICMYVCICTYVCTYTYVCICTYVCISRHVYVHTCNMYVFQLNMLHY
jgi:hypothetical protein